MSRDHRSPFHERSWADVREFEGLLRSGIVPEGQYLLAIIDSVTGSGVSEQLAVTTTMHDLVVVPRPIPEPPMDVLIVRAPGSLHAPKKGFVLIQYMAVSGRHTSIDRPVDDGVKLFWRFVQEELGVIPM